MSATIRMAFRRLITPRRLVALAVLAAVLGLVAGYIDVQRSADRKLALRQGPPAPVAVQTFNPRHDTGPAGEVMVIAEIDPSRAVVVQLSEADTRAPAWIAPLFPLSDLGRVRLREAAGGEGAVTAQLARRAPSQQPAVAPAGYAVLRLAHDTDAPAALEDVAARVYAAGTGGTVVALNGEIRQDAALDQKVASLFAEAGLQVPGPLLAVAPYALGREVALAPAAGPAPGGWLYLLALILILAAAVEHLREGIAYRRRPAHPSDEPLPAAEPLAAKHPSFAPLASQTELAREEEAEAAEAHPGLALGLRGALARFRSRR